MKNILIFAEDIHIAAEKYNKPHIKTAYPNGLHEAIAGVFDPSEYSVKTACVDNIRERITPEILAETDVVFWWGHSQHDMVPDDIAELVVREVQKGMGFIALHSAHLAKPFVRLTGTSCTLGWRNDDRERVWTAAPHHPIAAGVPAYFELEKEEMYSEPFDIPAPEDTVFIGWFAGGEVFRSGLTFKRGYGRIFYFQPGHEEYPIYYNDTIRLILQNAANWAAPAVRRADIGCPNQKPVEKRD
ncbi:MAG: ThuA domain-containing protein [Defluviitaleaceae bacterium]|nr:ThuA domain-containing protein [Defluviitaleaceae bacterium]